MSERLQMVGLFGNTTRHGGPLLEALLRNHSERVRKVAYRLACCVSGKVFRLGRVGWGRIGSGWIGPGRFGLSGVCADVLDSSTLRCILSRPQHIPDGSLRLAPNSLHVTRDWNETIGAGLQGQCRRPEKPPWEGPIASCPLPYTLVRTLQCSDGCIPDSGLYFIHVLSGVCGSEFVFLNASPIPTRSLSCPYG